MIITIAGNYGSAGLPVGRTAAELMNYRILDDETVEKMLIKLNLDIDPDDFRYYDENQGNMPLSALRRVSAVSNASNVRHYFSHSEMRLPLETRFVDAVRKITLEFAKDGNCIMVGRSAGYFLKPNKDLICIFTTDDTSIREQRTREFFGCDEAEAAKLVRSGDKRRAEYSKYFTGSKTWGDPKHYDYILRTSTLGIEGTAKLIQAMASIRK